MQGISKPPCCKSCITVCQSPSFSLFHRPFLMKKCIFFDTVFRTCPTAFPFLCLHTIVYLSCKRRRFVFITGIQNFSTLRLPRNLKKVEPTISRLDFKCFHNNQRIFFIYVFSNCFNRRTHFLCFVSCIYHCVLLIKVCVYVVLLLFEEIQTSGLECYDSKWYVLNEHCAKEKNFML